MISAARGTIKKFFIASRMIALVAELLELLKIKGKKREPSISDPKATKIVACVDFWWEFEL